MPAESGGGFDTALAELQDLVGADGGEIALVERTETSIALELILDSAECRECVMPRTFLEQIALDKFRTADAGVQQVTINDPREASS